MAAEESCAQVKQLCLTFSSKITVHTWSLMHQKNCRFVEKKISLQERECCSTGFLFYSFFRRRDYLESNVKHSEHGSFCQNRVTFSLVVHFMEKWMNIFYAELPFNVLSFYDEKNHFKMFLQREVGSTLFL